MSLYQIENHAYDRMEKLYLYVWKKCIVCIDVFFHKIQGNGGARDSVHYFCKKCMETKNREFAIW